MLSDYRVNKDERKSRGREKGKRRGRKREKKKEGEKERKREREKEEKKKKGGEEKMNLRKGMKDRKRKREERRGGCSARDGETRVLIYLLLESVIIEGVKFVFPFVLRLINNIETAHAPSHPHPISQFRFSSCYKHRLPLSQPTHCTINHLVDDCFGAFLFVHYGRDFAHQERSRVVQGLIIDVVGQFLEIVFHGNDAFAG